MLRSRVAPAIGPVIAPVLVLAVLLALGGCTSAVPRPAPATGSTGSGGPHLDLTGHQVPLPGLPKLGDSDRLHISCVAKTFCAIVDETGLTWTWTGTAWTGPVRFAPEGDFEAHIACASSTFCMASDSKEVYVFDGRGWTRTPHVDWPLGIDTLACAGPTYCVAGPASAKATDLRAWHGTGWTAGPDVDIAGNPVAVTCAPDGDTCGAAADDMFTRHGGAWSSAITPNGPLTDMSCTAGPFCMAAEHDHYGVWHGDVWVQRRMDDGLLLDGLACASAKFCLGFAKKWTEVWNGTSWAPGPDLPSPNPYLNILDLAGAYGSCPVDGWCMVTMPGRTFVYSAPS